MSRMGKHEEIVAYSSYEVTEMRDSLLGLQERCHVSIGFKCPRCSVQCPPLEHGQKATCGGCGLQFQLFGNGLHCAKGHKDR